MKKREIKFRVWDKQLNVFTRPGVICLLLSEKESRLAFNTNQGAYPIPDTVEENLGVNRFVIQQFTGLQDINGKEIYEGDVLKTEFHFRKKKWKGISYSAGFDLGELEKAVYFEEVKWGIRDADEYGSTLGWIAGDGGSLLDTLQWVSSPYDTVYRQDIFRSLEVAGNIFETPELLKSVV